MVPIPGAQGSSRIVARAWAAPLLVTLAAAAVYAATLAYDLVWDDTLLILQSERLHRWASLPSLLTTHFWAETGEASRYYRPLVTLTFFLDVQVWGLRPLGFHLTNVVAHVAVAAAVWALVRRAAGEPAATIAGLAFALHPLHGESVSFVSGRTDVLAGLFVVLALVAYDGGREGGHPAATAWSLGAFLLALLAKEVAIGLPALLVAWDRLVRDDLRDRSAVARAAARYAPYVAVVGLYLLLRAQAVGSPGGVGTGSGAPPLSRALTALEIAASYVRLTILPYPASPFYAIVPERVPPALDWWLAAAGLMGALIATAWMVKRAPVAGFGALWFWITLGPSVAVNLLPLPSPIMAERFLYLPTVGFCLILGWGAARLLGPLTSGHAGRVRPAPALALAGVLLTYALLTLWRNEDWRDDYTLYSRMVEAVPHAAVPHVNLALTQLPRGEIGPAREHLREAVRLAPGNAKAHAGLGLAETILGDPEAGLRHGLQARALAPRNADVLASLGALHLQRGDPARAVPELTESLRLKPNQVHAALNRALALAWLGEAAGAEVQLARALALVQVSSPDLLLADRVIAEVAAGRDPARARAAWARYVARLRATGQLTPELAEELGRVEQPLGRAAAPGPAR